MRGLGRVLGPLRETRGIPRWLLVTGGLITLGFVILAVFAPWIAPYDWDQFYGESRRDRFPEYSPPSSDHWFGTTDEQWDLFSRVVYGARTALEVVLLSVVVSVCIGVPLGLVSGYMGGWLDRVLVLIMDALFAFPYLLLAIVLAFVLGESIGKGVPAAAFAISAVYIPQYFRVLRNQVISVREEPYVEAARALGAKPKRIISRYVFLNVVQNVPVIATLNAADAIVTLAGLGFLGLGIPPNEAAEWGQNLQDAAGEASAGHWWIGLFPGMAIVLLVTGLTLVGEGLNDALNPVLRSRSGGRGVIMTGVSADEGPSETLEVKGTAPGTATG